MKRWELIKGWLWRWWRCEAWQAGEAGGLCLGFHPGRRAAAYPLGGRSGKLFAKSYKNMFAACRFSISYVLFVVTLSLSVTLLPIAGVLLASGSARYLAGISVLAAVLSHMATESA